MRRPSLGLMLLSLFLAFVVWTVVSAPRREQISERAYAAPLALVGMPSQLVITTRVPDSVNVRLRGRVSDLRSISSQNLEVTVDLRNAQEGEVTITVRPQAINVPEGVEVVSLDPNKLRFRIEQLRQKVVPIRPLLIGDPPAGYLAGTPELMPADVLISGPLSQIRNVSEVATERIIMTGRTATFVQNAAIVSDSPLVRIVEPLATQVTVPVLAEIGPQTAPAATDTSTTTTTTKEEPE